MRDKTLTVGFFLCWSLGTLNGLVFGFRPLSLVLLPIGVVLWIAYFWPVDGRKESR